MPPEEFPAGSGHPPIPPPGIRDGARRVIGSLVAAALVLLAAASFVWFFGWNSSTPDVTAYWRAGEKLLRGDAIYGPPPPGVSPKAFLYPPAFAVLFAPLTRLPALWAYATWMALHFVFLFWLVRASARLAGLAGERAWLRYLALLLLWMPAPTGGDFQEGQVNLLVASLVAGALLMVERGKSAGGGLLLALATHIKLLPALLLLPLLLQGRRRAVAAAVVFMAVLVLLPAVVTVPREGWSQGLSSAFALHADFVRTVVAPAAADAKVVGDEQFYVLNNSLVAVLHRLFGEGVAFSPFPQLASWHGPLLAPLPRTLLRLVALAVGAVLLAAALVLARRTAASRRGRAASLALVLAAAELTFLNCWEHHLVFVALLLAPLAAVERPSPALRRGAAIVCVAVFALWTGPYLIAPVAGLWGLEAVGQLLAGSRAWGLPTVAVIALGALAYAAAGGADTER